MKENIKKYSRLIAWISCLALIAAITVPLAGCSSSTEATDTETQDTEATEQVEATETDNGEAEAVEESVSLEGSQLNIYCGAGMTDPFTEIANAFQEQTGCTMNVTYANAAQIQTQITTTEEGDFFIAGSAEELQPVEGYVAESENLVKHIPVIAVPADNPKEIASLADLANADVLLIGDPESTPIGKIAMKSLTDAGIWEDLQAKGAITTTTTAPQIATALANGEGDAGIVWKENVKDDGVVIVDTTDLDSYVKVVPAALLTCSADETAAKEFQTFLQSEQAQEIWMNYGYELA
ncbi:MAG: molybdate ABC transporter substrate-binding protein [Eggerthellaceae bacterium]|nr:molybdate ABC transporter substrate-binding protein [Eggerthellaceae bacterium]